MIFLPVAAFRAMIFCPPRCSELHSVQWGHLSFGVCGIRCRQCWHLQNSVPERASSGTEYACRAQKGFLRYATHFQRHSVQKTGFWCTEWARGTGEGLLVYATRILKPSCVQNRLLGYGRDIRYRKRPPTVRDTSSKAQNSRLRRLWTTSCRTGHIFKGAKQPTPICAPPLNYPIRPYPSAHPHLKYGLNY